MEAMSPPQRRPTGFPGGVSTVVTPFPDTLQAQPLPLLPVGGGARGEEGRGDEGLFYISSSSFCRLALNSSWLISPSSSRPFNWRSFSAVGLAAGAPGADAAGAPGAAAAEGA